MSERIWWHLSFRFTLFQSSQPVIIETQWSQTTHWCHFLLTVFTTAGPYWGSTSCWSRWCLWHQSWFDIVEMNESVWSHLCGPDVNVKSESERERLLCVFFHGVLIRSALSLQSGSQFSACQSVLHDLHSSYFLSVFICRGDSSIFRSWREESHYTFISLSQSLMFFSITSLH